jgi:integrase
MCNRLFLLPLRYPGAPAVPKPLTLPSLDKFKPGTARREIPDGAQPGLYFIIQATGARSWAVRYRHNGRSRKATLGSYPRIKLPDARKLAQAALRSATEGKDPAETKITARRDNGDMFETIWDSYQKLHVATKRVSTQREVNRLFHRRILPRWRKSKIQHISRRDVIALADSMVVDGAPVSANRTITILSHFFTWAMQRDLIEFSPCTGIKKPTREKSRDRVLGDDEIRWIWSACDQIGWPFGPATKLLLLTGARRSEVLGMSDNEIDGTVWTLPAARVKNGRQHAIHLSPLALQTIDSVVRVRSDDKLIFTTTGITPVSGLSRPKIEIDAAMARMSNTVIAPWVYHDLRRTMATGMARLGVQLPIIERCLNHLSGSFGGVVGTYQRYAYAHEMRAAFETWSAHVEATICAPASKNLPT